MPPPRARGAARLPHHSDSDFLHPDGNHEVAMTTKKSRQQQDKAAAAAAAAALHRKRLLVEIGDASVVRARVFLPSSSRG